MITSDLAPGEWIISFLVETVRKLCEDTNVIAFEVLRFAFVTTKDPLSKLKCSPAEAASPVHGNVEHSTSLFVESYLFIYVYNIKMPPSACLPEAIQKGCGDVIL